MSNLPIYILAAVCACLVIYCMILHNKIEGVYEAAAHTALCLKNFSDEGKKEMSKLHAFCTENQKKLKELEKAQEEFSQLADESVRAQIESEKAWAEGVRAIAGFGADIPTLNTKGIGNE